jgi:hypothetical protein
LRGRGHGELARPAAVGHGECHGEREREREDVTVVGFGLRGNGTDRAAAAAAPAATAAAAAAAADPSLGIQGRNRRNTVGNVGFQTGGFPTIPPPTTRKLTTGPPNLSRFRWTAKMWTEHHFPR